MSAGRLRYVPPGEEAPAKPMFRLALRRRRRARPDRGRQEEARRRLARHPRRPRRRARAPRARRARRRRRRARQRSSAASAGSSIRSSATSARSRGSAARTRTRSSGSARLSPFRLSTDLGDDEVATLATAIDDDLARALELRLERQGRRGRLPHPRPLRRAVPARVTTPSAASTSRSTRSRTARPARPAGVSSRTAGSRGCSADPNRRSSLPGWRGFGSTASTWRTRSPGTAHLSSSCTPGSPIGRCGTT